ncbi:hypothetical protein Trydic_g23876 [Trypoxylus dichotomus]
MEVENLRRFLPDAAAGGPSPPPARKRQSIRKRRFFSSVDIYYHVVLLNSLSSGSFEDGWGGEGGPKNRSTKRDSYGRLSCAAE